MALASYRYPPQRAALKTTIHPHGVFMSLRTRSTAARLSKPAQSAAAALPSFSDKLLHGPSELMASVASQLGSLSARSLAVTAVHGAAAALALGMCMALAQASEVAFPFGGNGWICDRTPPKTNLPNDVKATAAPAVLLLVEIVHWLPMICGFWLAHDLFTHKITFMSGVIPSPSRVFCIALAALVQVLSGVLGIVMHEFEGWQVAPFTWTDYKQQDGNSEWMREVIYRLLLIMQSLAFAAFNLGVYGWPGDMPAAAGSGWAPAVIEVLQYALLFWTVASTGLMIMGPRRPVLDFKHWATDRQHLTINPAPVAVMSVFGVNALLYIVGMGLVFSPAGIPAELVMLQSFVSLGLTGVFVLAADWLLGRIKAMGVGFGSNISLLALTLLPPAVCVLGCYLTPKFWAAVPVMFILGAMVEAVSVETAFDQRAHALAVVWLTSGVWSQIELFKHLYII